jgi:glutamate synthase (NADPH) small chain
VHVYEKSAKPGGLLVYGIPDFKMEKGIVARRVKQMEAEGVVFHCGVHVGKDVAASELEASHDAVLLAGGSELPFDFFAEAPGRDLDGIHYAMTFLPQQNRRVAGEPVGAEPEITAKDKHVIVIGGGDTGSDCIGTSFRQGAKSVTQLEIMPMPPEKENKALSWPHWPLKLRVSSSQAEGAKVEYSISTTGFAGSNGKVEKLLYTRVDKSLKPVPGSEGELPADLVLFAMGFSGPVESDVVRELDLPVVPRGRFKGLDANERDYRVKARPKVFAAGDIRRGQSLVVWAIREGRQAAHAIDRLLMGRSDLPR